MSAKGYAVKDVFLTLQGEGAQAGRAAVFCRFTGCNLWSGREQDRAKGRGDCSRWCDTEFRGGARYGSAAELANAIEAVWGPGNPRERLAVLTGGEPSLQVDSWLVAELRARRFQIAIETNGTNALPAGIDHITVSPKASPLGVRVRRAQALKLVWPRSDVDPAAYLDPGLFRWDECFLQPLDGPDLAANVKACVGYCLANPRWRLSLQMHKTAGIP